jgi:predicted DsbA family dithiol-disulfide isomerase
VTDDLLQEVGAGAGLDVGRWQDEFDSDSVGRRFQVASQAATDAGIRGTPSFVFGGQQLQLRSLDPGDFSQLLDAQLAG